MSDPFLGEIRIFGGNFAPSGWALCNGATLSISQNTALFSLLGTTYGGNGTTTFNIPDLRGRTVLGFGQLTGGSNYTEGQVGGSETTSLTTNNLPAHSHTFAQNVSSIAANKTAPDGAIPAEIADVNDSAASYHGYTKTAATGTFPAQNTSQAGGSQPIANLPPYLVINYIIALQGIYPSRS